MILLESRCRGLCVTLTVMQTNRQTHVPEIHSRHCPVGVINKIKGLIYLSVWHVEYRKILCIIVSITSWQKRKHFYISLDTVILTAFITWYHKRTCTGGGGVVARVREYSLVSASPPQGQESGLISARHQTSLSLHTHTQGERFAAAHTANLSISFRCEMWLYRVGHRRGTPSKHVWRCWRGRATEAVRQ